MNDLCYLFVHANEDQLVESSLESFLLDV
jgi:hypothetical protein